LVSGTVTDDRRTPVSAAHVDLWVRPPGRSWVLYDVAVTSAAGRFAFAVAVPRGDVQARFRGRSGVLGSVSAVAPLGVK
jgi:hypothetical protein